MTGRDVTSSRFIESEAWVRDLLSPDARKRLEDVERTRPMCDCGTPKSMGPAVIKSMKESCWDGTWYCPSCACKKK